MIKNLDEAISHCEEVAEEQEKKARKKNDGTMSTRIKCEECASDHRQLANWLRELKAYREGCKCEDCKYQKSNYCKSCYLDDCSLWEYKGEVNADANID